MCIEQKHDDQCRKERTGSTIDMVPKISLVAFESGHYKKVTGQWKGDSVWAHFIKPDGKQVHINKSKVEYIEELFQ